MKITIKIEIGSDSVLGECNLLTDQVKGEYFTQCMEFLKEKIHREVFLEIQSGKLSREDPAVIRFFVGNDGAFALETELIQVEHDIYMEKIECLMRQHYPTLLNEPMWHMLVPRHNVPYCSFEEGEQQHKECLAADQREREAYDDLEKSGTEGIKWQGFLEEYMEDPCQNNKQFLIKHGLVKK